MRLPNKQVLCQASTKKSRQREGLFDLMGINKMEPMSTEMGLSLCESYPQLNLIPLDFHRILDGIAKT